jgi:hypothetical protein
MSNTVTVAAARTDLLTRVRMLSTIPFSVSNIYDILSKSQQLINFLLGKVVETNTLTTTANTYFYDLRAKLSSAMRVVSVVESDRTLNYFSSWKQFVQYSHTWLSDTDTRFEAWSQIGVNYLIIYPAKTGSSSVEVTYVKSPTPMGTGTDLFELPDEDIPLVIDLAEIFILITIRRYKELEKALPLFVAKVKEYE